MKQPRILVRPKTQTKEEKRMAKLTEKWLNFEYKKHKGFVEALIRARVFIDNAYRIKTVDQPWDLIFQAYIALAFKEKK